MDAALLALALDNADNDADSEPPDLADDLGLDSGDSDGEALWRADPYCNRADPFGAALLATGRGGDRHRERYLTAARSAQRRGGAQAHRQGRQL